MSSRDTLSETGIHDPEFLEWEAGLVGDLIRHAGLDRSIYRRGPNAPVTGSTNFASAMFEFKDDRRCIYADQNSDAMSVNFNRSEGEPIS